MHINIFYQELILYKPVDKISIYKFMGLGMIMYQVKLILFHNQNICCGTQKNRRNEMVLLSIKL